MSIHLWECTPQTIIHFIGFLSSLEKKLGLDWGNEDDSDSKEVEKGDIFKRKPN